jgi:hypothetical protein
MHQAVALPIHTARSCWPRSPERCASRCGAAHPASPLSPSLNGRRVQSVATVGYHPCQGPGVLASAAGGRRATVVRPRCGHTLRFYIRPHFRKCRPVVSLKLHLVPVTASRPPGFLKRALCKVAYAPAGCGSSAGFSSGASRSILVSGLRPCAGCQPPPTPGPRRFAALAPRGLPVRPPRGLPQPAQQPKKAALTRRKDPKLTQSNGAKSRKSTYIQPYIAPK